MARSDEERAQIDAAYEAERAAGPDFTRYHVGSSFEEPSEHRLNREDANRILVSFDVIRRGMFRHCRVPRRRPAAQGAPDGAAPAQIEQAAPPSLSYREVLRILLRYGVRYRRVFPKLATIAREACVSVRTVQYAIDWLMRFGFLDRTRRLVRERGPLGGVRCRQTSNAYRVGFPTGLGRLAQSVFRRIAYATGARGSPTTHAVAPTTRNTCDPFWKRQGTPIENDPIGEGEGVGFQCSGV